MLKYRVEQLHCTFTSKTIDDIHLYVRDDIGDDSNPGTLALPLKTLTEVENRIPDIVNHNVVVHLGPHPVGGWNWVTLRQRIGGGRIIFIGDGAGSGDGFTEIISSTAALAGSGLRVVKTSGLSVTEYAADFTGPSPRGALFGATIEILDGDAAGDRKDIWSNTATDIVPVCDFTVAIKTGDHYRVVVPSIHINFNYTESGVYLTNGFGSTVGGGWVFYGNNNPANQPAFFLINLEINDGYGYGDLSAPNTNLMLFGVKYDYSLDIMGYNTIVNSGVETIWWGHQYGDDSWEGAPFAVEVFGVPSNYSWAGWGLAGRYDDHAQTLSLFGATYTGSILAGTLDVFGDCVVSMNMGCVFGSGINVLGGILESFSEVNICAEWENIDIIGNNAVQISDKTSKIILHNWVRNLSIYGGNFTVISYNSEVYLYHQTSPPPLVPSYLTLKTYTASASLGLMKVETGGRIEIFGSSSITCQPATANHDWTIDGGTVWHPLTDIGASEQWGDPYYGFIKRW